MNQWFVVPARDLFGHLGGEDGQSKIYFKAKWTPVQNFCKFQFFVNVESMYKCRNKKTLQNNLALQNRPLSSFFGAGEN
jgi:hypothetical protein